MPNCLVNYHYLPKYMPISPLRLSFAIVVFLSLSISQAVMAAAKPKFFICPQGLERDATVVTEQYDVNLCSRTTPQSTIDLSTYTMVAIRNRATKKQINLPVTTDDDIVYFAQSPDGIIYKFDFNRRLLTIKSPQGKVTTEKIIASD
jgi:hypothetical protein